MEFITLLKDALAGHITQFLEGWNAECSAESLSAMEVAVQKLAQEVGQQVMSGWLAKQEPKYAPSVSRCSCGEQARYVRQRQAVTLTLQGKIAYRRGYYLCDCGRGHCPVDERLGIEPGQMSAEVKTVAALFGVQAAYAPSSTTLARLLPLELSPNSIRAACQSVGDHVLAEEAAVRERCQDVHQQTAAQRQCAPPGRLYVSLDGFQAPFADGWHELKAGVFWSVNDKGQAHDQQYFVDTLAADAFADLVWAKAWQCGADLAQQLVVIADGSTWIWRIAQRLFPNAVQIIDWFHASAYLASLAADAFGEGTSDATAWFEQHKALLHDGHLAELMRACRTLRPKPPLLRTPLAVTLPITAPACAIPNTARSVFKSVRA